MASTTVSIVSSSPSGLLSSSAVWPSCVPSLQVHSDTVSDDLQGPMDIIRELPDTARRPAASRLAHKESARNDNAVASSIVNVRNWPVASPSSEESQFRREVSHLESEVSSPEPLHHEIKFSWQRLADRGTEIDCLHKVLTIVRDLLDDGLGGPDGPFKVNL